MSSPGHRTLDTSILEIEEELLGLECNSDVAENRFQHIDASFAVIDLLNQSVQDDFDTNQSLQNGAERDDRDAERQLKVDERAKEDLRKETEELCTSFELLHSTANSVTAVDKNDIEATLLKLDARLDNLGKDNTSLMDATEAAKQRLASLNAQLMTKRKANGDLRSQLGRGCTIVT
ncbi:hypothetical protein AAVH_11627 [Aphelenchoides avenae]|nr:hypothetical protein AAVH_11627 [Aphelenchus avenae]